MRNGQGEKGGKACRASRRLGFDAWFPAEWLCHHLFLSGYDVPTYLRSRGEVHCGPNDAGRKGDGGGWLVGGRECSMDEQDSDVEGKAGKLQENPGVYGKSPSLVLNLFLLLSTRDLSSCSFLALVIFL